MLSRSGFSRFLYSIGQYLTLLLVLSSCAGLRPTGPNQPYQGAFPASYYQLVAANSLLALEIAKLPEIVDGISVNESAAVDELVAYYFKNKPAFDEAFQEMYRVGIPEVRRFCTPLQALFWLAEDGNLPSQADLVQNYDLYELLSVSWNFSFVPQIDSLGISEQKAAEIVSAIDKDVIWYAKNKKSAKDTLLLCYTRSPRAIPKEYLKFIESLPEVETANNKFRNNERRWSAPYEIIDRLNSIDLLDYYVDKNIRYAIGRLSYTQPISYTIKSKKGGCDDVALIGQIALNRAGYQTEARRIGTGANTHIGLVVKLADGRYILAVNFKTSNVVTGPHDSLYEADQALGYRPSMGYRGKFDLYRWD